MLSRLIVTGQNLLYPMLMAKKISLSVVCVFIKLEKPIVQKINDFCDLQIELFVVCFYSSSRKMKDDNTYWCFKFLFCLKLNRVVNHCISHVSDS